MRELLLSTAYTPDYTRAARYIASLDEHCNIPYVPMVIGRDVDGFGMPNGILQAGHFLDYLPPVEDDTVLIFTDADIVMHRPLDGDELEFLGNLQDGQISACLNMPREELFAEEATHLFPIHRLDGYEDVRVYNTGFVAAPKGTYKMLYDRFLKIWPEFDAAFGHYAKVQLCMCAAARDIDLQWVDMPGHICSQGHWGCAPGVVPSDPPTFNERAITFAHRVGN